MQSWYELWWATWLISGGLTVTGFFFFGIIGWVKPREREVADVLSLAGVICLAIAAGRVIGSL